MKKEQAVRSQWCVENVIMIDITQILGKLVSILMILVFSLLAYWLVVFFSHKGRRLAQKARSSVRRDDPRVATVAAMIRIAGGTVILFISGSLILRELKIDIAPLLTGAGIFGLIITFSVQTLLRDIVAGVFILFESQYGPGMRVTLNEHHGIVERMSLRTTVLRDAKGNILYIPNGAITIVKVAETEEQKG